MGFDSSNSKESTFAKLYLYPAVGGSVGVSVDSTGAKAIRENAATGSRQKDLSMAAFGVGFLFIIMIRDLIRL